MFDDMITDMEANKKLNPIVTELFLIVKRLNLISKWLKYKTKYRTLFYHEKT